MYTELKDRVAVISGAGGGLGAAVVRRLHSEGVRLVLLDAVEAGLQRLKAELGLDDANARLGVVDLTDKGAVEGYVAETAAGFGAPDILVNIAGGFKTAGAVQENDDSVWDFLYNLNVKTAFHLSGAVARQMVERGSGGRIVSVAARAGLTGAAGLAAYSASKSALIRLMESMAAELMDRGITANAVLPSTIDTPANRAGMPEADFSKWVTPESLAGVIAFLVSDSARDISGASLPVYGRA